MKKYFLFTMMVLFSGVWTNAQNSAQAPKISTAVYFDVSPALRDMPNVKPAIKRAEIYVVPNKTNRKSDVGLISQPFLLTEDPVWQKVPWPAAAFFAGPIQNFEGISNLSNVYPPDTQGDVGPNHYVQVVNSNFAVYSKTGAILLGPAALHTIWTGIPSPWNGTDDGDPVVLFDQVANRWMISQFSLPTDNYAMLVAISQTADPTGSWYRYVFQFGTDLPDYPKFGVWPDGYYMSVNRFVNTSGWNYAGTAACALERSLMITGNPSARMVRFDRGTTNSDPFSMLPADWDGNTAPPTGEANHFTYFDDWSSASQYFLKIMDFHVDWTNTSNSTFALLSSIPTSAFKSYICSASRDQCIPQPGTTIKLESLADRLMFRLQYRNFGTHRTMVTNHTVDVDASGHAGIRWYEIRNSGAGWTLFQEGTFAPDANHRWMGSIAMNGDGDIALGYSVSSATNIYPTIRYTGRRSSDPPGVLTIPEQTIINGSGSQTGSACRWGDYSMMSVDPANDLTFWYTNEYVQTTGAVNWQTRIASFEFLDSPTVQTLAVSSVTNTTVNLNGTVNPNGLATSYYFQWGATTGYGNTTTITAVGSGTATITVSVPIGGLIPASTYHYRIVGVNPDGNSFGADRSFVAGGAVVLTSPVTGVASATAICGGTVAEQGASPVVARGVCWSTTASPTIADFHTTDGAGSGTFTSTLAGLVPNTQYYVRAYATNGTATTYGAEEQFQTLCGIFTLPFTEYFPGTTIPNCWSQVDHIGNGQIWQFGVITGQSPNPALSGNYAFLNSDAYGSGNTQNVDLITPTINLSTATQVNLSFQHYFKVWYNEVARIYYSIDNGNNWVLIQQFTATSISNPTLFSQNIPAVAGQSQVKFKWNYYGEYGWYWAIDNIEITQPTVITVTPATRSISPVGGNTSFSVTTALPWSATSSQAWCSVTPSGTGNGTINAMCTSNPVASGRIATITVQVASNPPVTVTVQQSGLIPPTNLTGYMSGNNANLAWNRPLLTIPTFLSIGQEVTGAAFQPQADAASDAGPPPPTWIQPGDNPGTSTPTSTIYDNGPFVNSIGTGSGGADESIVYAPMVTFGFGVQRTSSNSIADDFTVPAGSGWAPTKFTFFAYQTNSSTVSTITGLYLRIYNGDPSTTGTVLWGDFTTNRMTSTTWSNVYRTNSIGGITTRPIMRVEAAINDLYLPPGTYWVEVQIAGSPSLSGPFMPPVTIIGTPVTGNAKQNLAGAWQDLMDGSYQQGIPFIIEQEDNGLVGYNLYRNGSLIQYLAQPSTTTSTDNNLQVGTYTYEVKAKYDLSVYGFPGQFGESLAAGPLQLVNTQNPVNLELTNITITSPQNMCFYATQNIILAGNGSTFHVLSGGSATLVAGSKISFLPGTRVYSQGYLRAYINPAGNPCSQQSVVSQTVLGTDKMDDPGMNESPLLKIFPNPTPGQFTLEINYGHPYQNAQVKIYNMLGNEIMTREAVTTNKTDFSLQAHPPGIYIIKVRVDRVEESIRVVKQ